MKKLEEKDYIWIVILLMTVILLLISMLISKSVNAIGALSAASNGISIVLSLVAILYTLISSMSNDRLNSKLQSKISLLEKNIDELIMRTKQLDDKKKTISDILGNIMPFVNKIIEGEQSGDVNISIDEAFLNDAKKVKSIADIIDSDFDED